MKNLKISHKISVFMLILILIAGGVAVKLVSSMSIVNEQSTVITVNWLPSVVAISEINTATSDFRLAETKHLGSTDPAVMKEAEGEMDKIDAHIKSLQKTYEPLISSPEEQQMYDKFAKDWATYLHHHKEFLALSQANRNDEASKDLYGDNLQMFEDASALLVQLVDLNKKGAEDASAQGDIIFAHERNIAIGAVIILLVLAGGCTFMLTRAVATPISGITDYMGILSGGDLSRDVPFKDRKDEIGLMAISLQHFKDGLAEAARLRALSEEERRAKELRQERINQATAKFERTMS